MALSATEPLTLSTVELQLLSEIDSQQFGFLKLNKDHHLRKRAIITKAIRYLERHIVRARERQRRAQDDNNNGRNPVDTCNVDPKIYCKLGHMHLLLEDYSKALSAYQKYYSLNSEHWRDACFLYGLGLVYYHYNAFIWSQKAFQQVLYVEPGFARAKEVHLRLALIAKLCNDYQMSLKHFRLAEDDAGPCTFSTLKIRFHVAHLHEVKGDSAKAKDIYEDLLKDPQLSSSLKADVYRQLGWMYHSVDTFGEKQTRIPIAIQHLQKSIEADPKSGQSLYLLGRCYASIGKVHEAFIAYRNSVDKSESNNADTWCSIGVLYQQQNQPMDALQAYICAVQLDKDHSEAWTNLGILYESVNQPQDALSCFNNAGRKRAVPSNLVQRMKCLKSQLSAIPQVAAAANKQKQLPSVEEAWNGQVSNEMTNRQPSKGANKEGSPQKSVPPQQPQIRPPFYLTQQQVATLQYLQNQPSLAPQQQQILLHLQQQFRLMQQHQQAARQQQQQQLALQQQQQQNVADLLSDLQNKDLGSVSDKELEDLISQQDIGSFAESLLKQIQADEGDNIDLDDIKTEPGTTPAPTSTAATSPPADKEKLENGTTKSTNNDSKISTLEIPTKIETVTSSKHHLKLDITLKSIDILQRCETYAAATAGQIKMSCSVLPEATPPPEPPERPKVKLTKEQLLPPTPSVYLENKKDAFSPQLQEFCLQHPITVVRGIAGALKLDLGLFSTKTLQEEFATHPVEVWTQNKQSADENWDPVLMKQVWHCPTSVSHCSIGKYAQYQAASFQEGLKDDTDKPCSSAAFRESVANESDPARRKKKFPILKFGANVDLSDNSTWRMQLSELLKLPPWTRSVSAGNMLCHLGHHLVGINTVRLYMKVPCARVPAHQENNNFCLININIGPGDCEWFGVPEEYWGALKQLCDKHKINYLGGSWWPSMHELMEEEIPVYRFLQRPGDLVWVNSGCVYWVQAAGWCNNIAWNVGPLTNKQYSLALERYEYNKLQIHKSAVGMVYLSWCLARNVRLSDQKLFAAIKNTLLQSLKQIFLTVEFVKSKGIEISQHKRRPNEPAHFCSQCEREVFSVLFIREEGKKHIIYCLDCAVRKKPELKGFVCLEEFREKELMMVYDNFKIHPPPSSSIPQAAASVVHHHTPTTQNLTPEFIAAAAAMSHYPLMSQRMDII